MGSIWSTLEGHTRDWRDLDRQCVADAVWRQFVTVRYAGTGDARALHFVYPYLHRGLLMDAIEVVSRVFMGRGPEAVAEMDYFTCNTDSYIRDRAVMVVGAALQGCEPGVVLETLEPFLSNRNRFIRRLAVEELSKATAGSGDQNVLETIRRVAESCGVAGDALAFAIARVFRGRPTDEVYSLLVRPDAPGGWRSTDWVVGSLLRGAPEAWYERTYEEFFKPRLHAEPSWESGVPMHLHLGRSAVDGLCQASSRRGMDLLDRVIHFKEHRLVVRCLLACVPECFVGADGEANLGPLLAMAGSDEIAVQRLALACLGALMEGSEEADCIEALRPLCEARDHSVRASALSALGRVARSSGDEEFRALCLSQAGVQDMAPSAVRALGEIFRGSGRFDVLDDIRRLAESYRLEAKGNRRHSKPLLQCYAAAGHIYQGTGLSEPLDFLLMGLTPTKDPWNPYRHAASAALVSIEFSERRLARVYGNGLN